MGKGRIVAPSTRRAMKKGKGNRRSPSIGRAKPKRPNYGRLRALSLMSVYVLFALHIIHWKITGKTLAPLELNEVMYTLELGIITAGFLFMCALVAGTMVFGRFFCSWACHIMALQDGCAWLLRRFGLRAKPIRSRMLLFVPPLTAFYMFLWPQIARAWREKAVPAFHLASDADGWASFSTNNFWRNLPGPWVIAITFLVCGFAVVYLLGSRTFCTYVCPYGAVFALADRFAPGRIRVTEDCKQCGRCTATCTSAVRVHDEIRTHGMVVNSACMKDLDCVSVCPQNALYYGFAKPAPLKLRGVSGRFGLPYDFSFREELLIAITFLIVLFSLRGLYGQVPFLLALALGAIAAYLGILVARIRSRDHVVLSKVHLKRDGRIAPAGRVFLAVAALLAALVLHSGFVRYHERWGIGQARALSTTANASDRSALAQRAYTHLKTAAAWSLLRNPLVERGLVTTAFQLDRPDEANVLLFRYLRGHPYDPAIRLLAAKSLAANGRLTESQASYRSIIADFGGEERAAPSVVAQAHLALGARMIERGDYASAVSQLQSAVRLDEDRPVPHAELGSALAELGRFDEAIASLRVAVRLDPGLTRASYNLGTLLGLQGRFTEAIPLYERAIKEWPDDADINNNFGLALLRTEQPERARHYLARAVSLNNEHADAHFNLGSLLAAENDLTEAERHFREAARLDDRYARLLLGE